MLRRSNDNDMNAAAIDSARSIVRARSIARARSIDCGWGAPSMPADVQLHTRALKSAEGVLLGGEPGPE